MRKLLFVALSNLLGVTLSYGQCSQTSCPSISLSSTSTSCYNASTGTASVSVSTLNPYTITWQGGSNAPTISNLAAGTYTVSVQDNCTGCVVTGAVVVNSPNPLQITSSTITDVSCFNGSDGQVQIVVAGGTPGPGYTFDWSNDGTSDFDDLQSPFLTAGTHTVVVKDNNGCTTQQSYFVDEPSSPVTISYTVTDAACNATPTGSIDVSMNGTGTPPYTYDWTSLASTNEDQSGLYQGTYPLEVTDYNGCLATASITVSEPLAPLATDMLLTPNVDVSCFGYSDGQVSTDVTGGTPPYSYSWSNSTMVFASDSPVLSNIPSDIYTVVVTDANGCQTTDNTPINTPTPLVINSSTVQNVECYGEATGEITVNPLGGTPTYTYVWLNSSGATLSYTGNVASGLVADEYTVIITDDNGCQIIESYTVTQPGSPVSIILNGVTDVLCYGENTGEINIAVTGGTPGYLYNWVNASGTTVATTEDLSGQPFGTYTITVSDFYGCDSTISYYISQPSDTLIATHIMTPVVCFGESNGSINVTTTGGTSPYSYAWTNSTYQLSTDVEDLINFPSDTYYMVITDINGCQYLDTFFISEPPLLTGSTIGVDILCKYDATGEIDLTLQGGVTPYLYQWTNSGGTLVGTTEDLTNLVADTYDLLATDANGCTFETSVTLTEPDDTLGFVVAAYPVVCHGDATGYIELEATGGTPLYSVLWSSADTTMDISGLTAGWYEFLITDDHGCQIGDSVEVTQPDLLLTNEVVTDVSCYGYYDGVIDISPSGGNPPYSYTWYNSDYALSAQTQDLVNFPADTYQLELTDSLGCFTEIFVDLPEPEPIVIEAETIDVTCAGGSDGSIDVTVTGGNPAYTYLWSNGATTEDLINIPIDTYTIWVTDTKNCQDSLTIEIFEPDPIVIDFVVEEVSCADQYDGYALASPYGGTGDFTYLWSNGVTTDYIDSVYGGTYSVTVTDIVGCEMTDSTFIPTNPQSCIDPPNAFTPNGDLYNDTWFLENSYLYPDISVKIFNRWGNLLYEQNNVYEPWDGIYNGQPVPSATYYYIINLNNYHEPYKGIVTIVR